MSGNAVLAAVHAAAGDRGAALLQLFTIGMFLAGLVLSGITIEAARRARIRRLLAAAMLVEAALLIAFAAALGPGTKIGAPRPVLLALAAAAMGCQNTALRMAGILGVYTTHVTGTLTRLSEDLVAWAWSTRPARGWAEIGRSAALFAGFAAGALAGALLAPSWGGGAAMGLPILLVLAVAAADLARPFAGRSPP